MNQTYQWAVIGAGPAGIAAVGKLLDHGVKSRDILWLDPEFKVGDFGRKWQNVSSNTRVNLFIKFYQACQSFQFSSAAKDFEILHHSPEETCLLYLATEPLQYITEVLKSSVHCIQNKVLSLKSLHAAWEIILNDNILYANHVILAPGSEPKSLSFPDIKEIPLQIALDPEKLSAACDKKDVIAVFGSSHSAIIIVQSLLEVCKIEKVINFYLEPLRYAVYYQDWILHDDTGLKGKTAEWARKHIDTIPPEKLLRLFSHQENIKLALPECSHAIYATGFERRNIPIEGMDKLEYDNKTGRIADGLFGVGIAFPEAKVDRHGTLEYRVGLWKFMEYLESVVPKWMGK